MQASFSIRQQLERYHAESFGWAMCCCGRKEEAAKEVLQIAYLKILEGKAKFKNRSSFKTWLFSVIRFTALDWYKQQKVLGTKTDIDYMTAESEICQQDKIIAKEVNEVIKDAVKRLPGRQYEVLHLVFYNNLTIEEAAKVMDISIGSARTHYKRGKLKLKDWLKCRKTEWQ